MLSPLAAACGTRIGAPPSLSMVAVDWKRLAATAPPLWLFWPGCGDRWGACIDTRCVSLSGSRLPGRPGRAGFLIRDPRLASAGWRCAHSCGKPHLGWRLDASRGFGFRVVGCGRWNAQWGLEEKAPSGGLTGYPALAPGSARSMAMLTYRTNRLPAPSWGGGTVIRPAGDSLPSSGSRQLPG